LIFMAYVIKIKNNGPARIGLTLLHCANGQLTGRWVKSLKSSL